MLLGEFFQEVCHTRPYAMEFTRSHCSPCKKETVQDRLSIDAGTVNLPRMLTVLRDELCRLLYRTGRRDTTTYHTVRISEAPLGSTFEWESWNAFLQLLGGTDWIFTASFHKSRRAKILSFSGSGEPRQRTGISCPSLVRGYAAVRLRRAAVPLRRTGPRRERLASTALAPAASRRTRSARFTEAVSGNIFANSGSTSTRFVPACAC